MSGSFAQGAYTVKYNAPARWATETLHGVIITSMLGDMIGHF